MNRHERRKYKALHGASALRVKIGETLPYLEINREKAKAYGMEDGHQVTFHGDSTVYLIRLTDGPGVLT